MTDADVERIAQKLGGAKPARNGGWMCLCPAHSDKNPSLSLSLNKDGQPLVHCFAGCSQNAVIAKIKDLGLWGDGNEAKPKIEQAYDYLDADGNLVHQTVRMFPKGFWQRRPDGHGGWIKSLKGIKTVLYRLPELLAAKHVYVVEGEKDVHTIEKLGRVATCNPMGAGKWQDHYSEWLKGKIVFILVDNDDAGRNHAAMVALSLHRHGIKCKIVELPNLPEKGDVTDWKRTGGTKAQLIALVKKTPWYEPKFDDSHVSQVSDPDDDESLARTQWPDPLGKEAFYGLAGDVVKTIKPHSESDPAALLAQTLVIFGNLIGRHPYWQVEGTKHFTNLFLCLVGPTSHSRKGTSLDRVLQVFESIDPTWLLHCRKGGLSTGEGLIYHVRDRVTRVVEDKKSGMTDEEIVDPGVTDKRLMVEETEFGRTLQVMAREKNPLSAIMRQAWDKDHLAVLTKTDPYEANGAHISIIAHITKTELERHISNVELFNGFANRFLWVCARRRKPKPFGGSLDDEQLKPLIERAREAVEYARSVEKRPVAREKHSLPFLDEAARDLWKEYYYDEFSKPVLGLVGGVTDRAAPQIRRLACIYALLDCKDRVSRDHLRAALAVWRYCFDSAKFIFGGPVHDPTGEAIVTYLRNQVEGATRTQLREDLFLRNKPAEEIGESLASLQKSGLVRSVVEKTKGPGRPATRWVAV
jgi:hypothetical protein